MATCSFCGVNIPQLPQGNEVYHPDDLVCEGCLDEPEANPYLLTGEELERTEQRAKAGKLK